MGAGASVPAIGHPKISNLRSELAQECEKPADLSDFPAGDEAALREEVARMRKWVQHARQDISHAFKEPDKAVATPSEDTVIKSDDGTEVHLSKTGHRKQIDPDGTVIEVWPNGRKLQTSKSGRTLEVLPDGTRISKHGEACVTSFPDGSKRQENGDGTVIAQDADGVIIQTQGDITIEARPDGTQTTRNSATGTVSQKFADGTRIDTSKDGHRIIAYTDGRRVQRNPNGTVIETKADGTKIQSKIDGSRIEIYADGRRIQQDVDGSVQEIFPDGRVEKWRVSNRSCVSCTNCKTIVSVQQGQFITICPMCRNLLMAHKTDEIGSEKSDSTKKRKSPQEVEEDLKALFDRFDVDKSLGIDKKEAGRMLQELQFPPDSFEDVFNQNDMNSNGQLNFDSFCNYFNALQAKIVQSSQEPVLEMTKDLLEEQRKALDREKQLVEKRKLELEAAVRSGNLDAEAAVKTTQETLARIKEEHEIKSKQLENTKNEQKQRQRAFLQKKIEERKLKAAVSKAEL